MGSVGPGNGAGNLVLSLGIFRPLNMALRLIQVLVDYTRLFRVPEVLQLKATVQDRSLSRR